MLNTPVAFLIFNRPDLTSIVFEAIRQAKPKKLLVVADGPRFPEEAEKCKQAREVIDRVDWACEVLTNFSDKNLGCGVRVSSGLDWVFSEVEEAIILEDDCLPGPSFFYFCQTLLEYYRHDERIMHISGNNLQFGQSRSDYSYYFSKYGGIWGWASWRRAWKHFDRNMKTWPEFKAQKMIESVCEDPYEQDYWTNRFEYIFQGSPDIWDYHWLYARWCQSDLSIIPNSNLVSNIGFGSDATHTFNSESPLAKLPITDIWKIKHPPFMIRNRVDEIYTFDKFHRTESQKNNISITTKIHHRFSSLKIRIKSYFSVF
jgi:hypothetical protein